MSKNVEEESCTALAMPLGSDEKFSYNFVGENYAHNFTRFWGFAGLLRRLYRWGNCSWRKEKSAVALFSMSDVEQPRKHTDTSGPSGLTWHSPDRVLALGELLKTSSDAWLQSERWQQHSSQQPIMSAFHITLEKSLEGGRSGCLAGRHLNLRPLSLVEWEANWDR